jgi:hypothetical protein
MKTAVWLAFVVLASCWGLMSTLASKRSLDPGQQAKVSTALDSAQFILSTANDEVQAQSKVIKEALKTSSTMSSVDLLEKQTKLMKIGSAVGRALQAVQAAAAIASFIFTFFMPSDLEVITNLINERFKEVNSKLDSLDEKLDEIEVSIKANTAFNTFLATWINWEYASKNGAKKLSDIRQAMSRTSRRIEQVKLAEEYINYYENNNLDGNLLNLYRMAADAESTTNRNIFDRFIDEHGCDIGKLSELMIIIQNVMTSAAQQQLTYYFLKGDETRATDSFSDVQTYFFAIRRAFDDRVWNCRSNSIDHARDDAKTILKKTKNEARENVVKAIFSELKVKYPWYTWAVAAAEAGHTDILGLEWRGSTYFSVEDRTDPDKVKTYYVVYEDTKAKANCIEIKQVKTLMVFKRCDGCNSDYIYLSDNILSEKNCPSSTLEQLVPIKDELIQHAVKRCRACSQYQINNHFSRKKKRYVPAESDECIVSKCVERLQKEIQSLDFIASAVNINYDICGSEQCGGQGQCMGIPFTRTHQCICNSHYEGESCEKRIDFDDTITNLMAELRRTFNVVNGVPTAVDVFFSIKSLADKLDLVLQKIRASFAHTNNIIQHSKIIYNAEDIADLYAKLQKDELSFDQFGNKIHSYLRTVTQFELQNRLKKMILGQGMLDTPGNDIYNSYKREYASLNGGVCSSTYNADIKALRDNLAYLDEALGEAFLLHQKWLYETQGTTDDLRANYQKEAEYIFNLFKDRQEQYNQYWESYSCGPISVSGTNAECKSELTFEGMTLPLQCDQQRQATPTQLSCRRINGVLEWDSQPRCKFVWGKYGGWGSCSKTCDGGYRYRYRSCLGTSDVSNCKRDQGGSNLQTEYCNGHACCSAMYGKFKCSNGRCIQKKQVCDGHDNCGNGDDESKSRCPNIIRTGDMIAMESNSKRGQWLSCYCTVNCGYDRCRLRGCPGNTMEGNDWTSAGCPGERFRFYGIDGSHGQAVHHGDRVAIQYGWDYSTGRGNWLSCWVSGSVCPTSPCPGLHWEPEDTEKCRGERFWIFSPDRRGSCSSDIMSGCRGEPIQKGDTVFILYGTPSWFLSEDGGSIRTRSCPGRYLTESDKTGCICESWRIFSR